MARDMQGRGHVHIDNGFMSFDVEIGHASLRGQRDTNDDFAGALRSAPGDKRQGLVAAIADGVSTAGQGRLAAQTAVRALLDDFFAVPATWDTSVALDRLITAHNAWLVGHNKRAPLREPPAVALTTLTALALQGPLLTVAHVGDTRAWRLRDGDCQQLTQDHAFDHPDFRNRLTRVLGLDDPVRVDMHQVELRPGDLVLLSTDGVHGVLPRARIAALAQEHAGSQALADALVQAALAAGSRDNASALVVRVHGLDAAALQDELVRSRTLPVPHAMKVGESLDGLTVTALVEGNGAHRLYQVRRADGRLLALKTLQPQRSHDEDERATLAHEAWLSARVTEHRSDGFVAPQPAGDPSAFYALYDWHSGRTLEQRLAGHEPVAVDEVVAAAIEWLRALGRLHRLGVVHRDLKPANLHLGEDGRWRILDLGVAVSGQESDAQRALRAGTPSYMNPEQWEEGGQADAGSDLYAIGVTLYRWLTGRLPFGDLEPYQSGRFRRDPQPPSRHKPEVPIWLDHVVLKAIAHDPGQRFETAEEFLLALERGAGRPLPAPLHTPLLQRDPALVWKAGFAVSLLFNVLLVVWLLFLPR
jgi:serine/threonine protein phosphatase PrpC